MPIPRCIATLALMPKSALNKCWRYIEGALYIFHIYLVKRLKVDNTHTKHFNAAKIEDRSHIVFILSVNSSFYLSKTLTLWRHIMLVLAITLSS